MRGNLPGDLTSFVGREAELARLQERHKQTRLLTLVGPGGVGKTRLALRLARELGEGFPDGVWLLDLTPVTDPALVPQKLSDVLGVQQHSDKSCLPELIRVLRGRRVLLVLDNCEHLVAACAEMLDYLLRACPELRVLATSLQPLGAAAETTWRVSPLSLPAKSLDDLTELQSSEAVRLFVARVKARVPEFALSAHNAVCVAEMSRQLDGLPLALELVAARVESLGVAEVAARLADRFVLAVSATRNAPARHQTLQAALDWSSGLLDEHERVLLRRLGVFVGGWTLHAAELVCAGDGLPHDVLVDALNRLVTISLVGVQHGDLTVRYRLLETVRAHARQQLELAGETIKLQLAHARYMLELAERTEAEWLDVVRVTPLAAEEDNLRASLESAFQHEQLDLAVRLANAAWPMWLWNGHYLEGCTWFDRILALPGSAATAAARSVARTRNSRLRLVLGDYDMAQAHCERAFEEERARDDALGMALALDGLARVAEQRGDLVRAAELFSDVCRHLRDLESPRLAGTLLECAIVASEIGEVEELRELIRDIDDIARDRRDSVLSACVVHLNALVAKRVGDSLTAAELLEQELATRRAEGGQQAIIKALTILGHVRVDLGQHPAALRAFSAAIARARATGERVRLIRALEGYARCLSTSDPESAVRLAGATDGQRQLFGAVPWPSERQYLDAWLKAAQHTLGRTTYPGPGRMATPHRWTRPSAWPRHWLSSVSSTSHRAGRSAPASGTWRGCWRGVSQTSRLPRS